MKQIATNNPKLLALATFYALMLCGCGKNGDEEIQRKTQLYDEQIASQKIKQQAADDLKKCFHEALGKKLSIQDAGWNRIGCIGKSPDQLSDAQVEQCNVITHEAERAQKEEEDRCVKIYK